MAIVQTPQYWIKNIAVIGMVAILAACGGGGSSSDDGAKNPPPANDTTPNAFTFTAVEDAEVNTSIISGAITIAGINTATPISITGGEYAIGGGPYTATSGTITNNQRVTVKLTSSENTYQEATATLKVGDKTAIFSITTKPNVTPDSFSFEAKVEAIPGESYTSNTITVSGIDVAVPVSITGGEYAIDNGDFTTAAATVSAGQTIVVRATAAPTLDSIVDVELTIGGVKGIYSIITPVDKTPPTAEFMFPPPVSMTDGDSILVRGVASDDYSEIDAVTVNGIEVESTDNFATWQARVPLTAGDNKLVVETTDAVGNPSPNAAEVMVRRGAITEAFPDAANEFNGMVGFVIDRLDGRDRLITVDGSADVMSVDLSTGERIPFINPQPFGAGGSILGIALDKQAKEIYFREGNTILVQSLDDETIRVGSDIKLFNGAVCLIDDLDEEVRIVVANNNGNGNIFVTDFAVTEFTLLSSGSMGIPDAENPIGATFGGALDRVGGRYLLTDLNNQRIVAVNRLTGKRDYFSSNSIGTGDAFGDMESSYLMGIAIDEDNSRALVAEYLTGRLFSVDLVTGNRALLSDSSEPNTGVVINKLYAVKINTPLSYAFVADDGLKAVIAIDVVTGHRVVFSKSATTP